jgi:hypothetical protein
LSTVIEEHQLKAFRRILLRQYLGQGELSSTEFEENYIN